MKNEEQITEEQIKQCEEYIKNRSWIKKIYDSFFNIGWCIKCSKPTKWKSFYWNPIHEDGPPLFCAYFCKSCGYETPVCFSSIMEDAVSKSSSPNKENAAALLLGAGIETDPRR